MFSEWSPDERSDIRDVIFFSTRISLRSCGLRVLILPDGQITSAFRCTSKRVHPPSQKFSAFAVGQINFRTRAVSCPPEGRIAIVTTRWARDAMDAVASGSIIFGPDESAAAYGEVVWS